MLNSLGVTVEGARARLATGEADEIPSAFLPYTQETQKVLELALGEEPTQHPTEVGTEHLLLGLVGASEQTVLDLGVEPERIRERVRRVLTARTSEDSSNR